MLTEPSAAREAKAAQATGVPTERPAETAFQATVGREVLTEYPEAKTGATDKRGTRAITGRGEIQASKPETAGLGGRVVLPREAVFTWPVGC